jgi:hypothetical protein
VGACVVVGVGTGVGVGVGVGVGFDGQLRSHSAFTQSETKPHVV